MWDVLYDQTREYVAEEGKKGTGRIEAPPRPPEQGKRRVQKQDGVVLEMGCSRPRIPNVGTVVVELMSAIQALEGAYPST